MMGIKSAEAKLFYEFSLDRRIPRDHLLRRIEQAVDFSFVYSLTRPYYSHTGQPSVDPVALFKMALLGYLYGLPSERRLAQEVELNLAYRWFLGYDLDEATPNHSVLSKARRRFGKQVYEEFFRRVVLQCEAAGLIDGTTLYLDSTLVPASADVDSARSRVLLQQLPGRPEEFVERLWESNPDVAEEDSENAGAPTGQHTVNQWISSRTDPEAAMVSRGRGYPPHFAYKDHLAVDGGWARIVTAVRVTSGQRADEYELPNLVEGHSELLGRMPRRVAADRKYATRANYEYLLERNIAPSIPEMRRRHRPGLWGPERFIYDLARDLYWCPAGEPVTRRGLASKQNAIIYRADPRTCRDCPLRPQCTTNPQGRRILRFAGEEQIERARAHLRRPQAKEDIRRRKAWIEGVIADAKSHHGLSRARCRGLTAMTIQALLVASAQNIKKLAAYRRPAGLAKSLWSAYSIPRLRTEPATT
ncbi:MAG: IS1182 family transposase [Candidatus Dormibacteraeota bacterium]|nr:IS1182 family transposase [Candidatus Dormibacteraeota bacterium]